MGKTAIIIMMLLIGLGFATVQTGEYTLSSGGEAGVQLSTGKMSQFGSQDAAFADILVEPWDRPAWCANHQRLNTSFEQTYGAPTFGYSTETSGREDCTYVSKGVYAVKTRDNKYAIVEITDATHSESGNSNYLNGMTFRYKLQSDGSPSMVAQSIFTGHEWCVSFVIPLSALLLGTMRRR